jgi:hypothetical protein
LHQDLGGRGLQHVIIPTVIWLIYQDYKDELFRHILSIRRSISSNETSNDTFSMHGPCPNSLFFIFDC